VARSGPTIYEVARRAGVSIATVSRTQRRIGTVAPETRRRVLHVIDELGYRPSGAASSLAARRHDAAGIVLPNIAGPYFAGVIEGYESRSVTDRQSVLILGTHGRPHATELVLDLAARVDGLVVLGRTIPDALVRQLADDGLPVVLVARPAVDGTDDVRSENLNSAMALTKHLLAHGYQRLVFLGDPDASPDAKERWDGFEAVHRAQFGDPVPAVRCDYRESSGYRAAGNILDVAPERRPQAIVAANDEIAFGVMRACRERDLRIPDDIALTGWDDVPMAGLVAPALTTVAQPLHELGATAAALLRERVRGRRTEQRRVLLPTRLIVRESCGCRSQGGGA
jgi:LacI family transcriptional regulator, galactose operon repressor